jgi:hypothetical protein
MTQDELKAKLHYNPQTGIFTHLKTHRSVKTGDIAGHADKSRNGYIKICINKNKYMYAHRLAFLYMWGYIPNDEVDHIDHNPGNNSWNNLRIVNHKENGKNQKQYISNTSGITGVRQRSNGSWRARIYHQGAHIDLGTYTNKEDAINARVLAEINLNFHKNHGKCI